MSFQLELVARDPKSSARAGILHTPHGPIETPVFAPVGTAATVKALSPRDLKDLGASLVLSNAYHLYLRPGDGLIRDLGGLHRFMAWDRPILTDSGGFQVFSLGDSRQIDPDGVTFRSHIDGSLHRFTPERVMQIQENLGADIVMCFDECSEPHDRAYNELALARTHAWAERCKASQSRQDQALFGIVQGGIFADLRRESATFLVGLDFAGYAIGGLSVGETKQATYGMLEVVLPLLPQDKPRYLMGVGAPEDLVNGVLRGVDLFDCVLPTRLGRNGAALVRGGRINLRNARHVDDPAPIDPQCGCYACRHFSRSYLRHLTQSNEILGHHLISLHNVYFLVDLAHRMRAAILAGTMTAFAADYLSAYPPPGDERNVM
jgi:queuine tRNA-ribosyltransferase